MSVVFAVTFGLLSIAGLLVAGRLLRGPSTLDRILALDVLSVLLAGGLAADAARRGSAETLVVLLVVSLLGFTGTLLAVRFVGGTGAAVTVTDWISAVLLSTGAGLCLLGAIGMVAFPDLLTRLHAAAKAQTAGLLLLLVGAAVQLGGLAGSGLLVVAAFQLATAPAVAQAIGRVAYREGVYRPDVVIADEPAESDEDFDPAED